jgi:predicted nucleic acid-binding protein
VIGLDTTVLLAFEVREASGHAQVRGEVEARSRRGAEPFGLAPQVLQEFLHVVTDERRFKKPLTMVDALERATAWRESVDVQLVYPGEDALHQFTKWMALHRLGRKRILDTYLAATYFQQGIRRLATANPADFHIFGEFTFEAWACQTRP